VPKIADSPMRKAGQSRAQESANRQCYAPRLRRGRRRGANQFNEACPHFHPHATRL
jgi:hypothetical protein